MNKFFIELYRFMRYIMILLKADNRKMEFEFFFTISYSIGLEKWEVFWPKNFFNGLMNEFDTEICLFIWFTMII